MQQPKHKIIADSTPLLKRKNPVHKPLVAALVPLFGLVTAYGIAPDTVTRDIPIQTQIDDLTLPKVADPLPAGQVFYHQENVLPGETLAALLSRVGVSEQEIHRLLASPAGQVAGSLRVGQRIHARVNDEGELIELTLFTKEGKLERVTRQTDGFTLDHPEDVLETMLVMRSGRIESSLFAATDVVGIPDSIAEKMAEIFGTRLDFREDLRKGDTFSVVYQVNTRNGEPVGIGKVLAAEYVNAGKVYRAVLYRSPGGQEAYYTPEGESLKKGFLRSPLEFSRITSGFSNSRKHPIYGFHRKHTGVDFGAPTGTRVKATGDAVVSFVGRKGGYGNLIILRHPNGYETYYAHLQEFAKGLRKGRVVEQGEVIGYVGSTGTSTGPHLHYEVRIAGIPQNPMTVKLPGSPPLSVAQKVRFRQQTAVWIQRLDQLRGTNLAVLD